MKPHVLEVGIAECYVQRITVVDQLQLLFEWGNVFV